MSDKVVIKTVEELKTWVGRLFPTSRVYGTRPIAATDSARRRWAL